MQLTFRIHYRADWGQRLALVANRKKLGNNNPAAAVFMQHEPGDYWTLTVELKDLKIPLEYKYYRVNDTREISDADWGAPRRVDLAELKSQNVTLSDVWRSDSDSQNSLYTSAFTGAIFQQNKHKKSSVKKSGNTGKTVFRIYAPRVKSHEQICICGSASALGSWNLEKAVLLGNADYPMWTAPALSVDGQRIIEYKYGIYDTKSKRVVFLEEGENRQLNREHFSENTDTLVHTDTAFKHPAGEWKGTGVAVPVFSLRSKKSLGTGEFTDLNGLTDWAEKTGMKMVQILPVNDTNATGKWTDSYPYAAVSVFALHPQYLNISVIDGFEKAVNQTEYKKTQKQLNSLPEADYEAVMRYKSAQARKIFDETQKDFLADPEFKIFFSENEHWLKPYAAFCYLRDKYGTAEYKKWAKNSEFSPAALQKLTNPRATHFSEIAFWYFIQYHLDKQLKAAGDYARSKGVILKGDIPIGIYRHSADAWTQPELYNMDGQSGAPPDDFSDIGQNWGFPTYNWEEMAKDGFQWWKNRFTQLSRYFDAFRIDHILGFFRIWQIPTEQVQGSFGFFNPALPVRRGEFAERGIWFDYERWCLPYITPAITEETFGEDAQSVGEHFMEYNSDGRIQFKKKFDTQRKVEAYVQRYPQYQQYKEGLYTLLSNVLFFSVPDSDRQEFHPRIDLMKTTSFRELPPDMRAPVEVLYNDYFYRRQEDFWRASAMSKLPAIREATNMLICGEDLGMVPDCVPGVMDELKILTLEIQRMSKNPQTEFLQEADIPYLSVASPSTHDMSPLRLWWREMSFDQRQRFWYHELHESGEAPAECTPEIAKRILQMHLHWKSMWVVFPLQDILAVSSGLRRANPEEERINVPANPQHYWRYRLHLNTEDLMKADEFNEDLSRMIMVAGR